MICQNVVVVETNYYLHTTEGKSGETAGSNISLERNTLRMNLRVTLWDDHP